MAMRRPASRALGVALIVVVASCIGDGTGPGIRQRAQILLSPSFVNPAAARLVDFDQVRIRLDRPGGGAVLDTLINFPAGADSITLNLQVAVQGASEQFDLRMDLIDLPSGQVVFSAGPTSVTAQAGVTSRPPTPPFDYVGTGANAAGVRFVATASQVFFLDTVVMTAEAFDGAGVVIPGTPIRWTSSDTARARIPADSVGRIVARTTRGAVTITAALLTSRPPVSQALVVQPRANAILVQAGDNQQGAVGAPLTAPITARVNAADNLGVQGVTVTFTVASGGGTLSSATAVTNASGDASVTWTLGAALGPQSVTATAAGVSGSTAAFAATGLAGAPRRLAFLTGPSNANAGQVIVPPVRVAVQDSFGNTVTTATGSVTLALGNNPGGATLGGTTTVAAVAGVATFADLTLNAASAGYTLLASATGLTGATSAPFTVTSSVPTQLAFGVQPATTVAGVAIAPAVTVTVRDAANAIVATSSDSVFLALAANPGADVLGGVVRAAAVNGVATFSGLTLTKAAAGYTLAASSPGLTGATSAAFGITPAAAASLLFSTQPPATSLQGEPFPVAVSALDAFGNPATGFTGTVTVAIGANPGGASLGGTASAAAVAGVATFGALSLDAVGTGFTLTAAATGLTGATSTAFAIGTATLLHYYPFTIDASDAAGTANGTLTGGATVSGGALALDGSSGYVQLPGKLVPTTGSFSVAMLVRHRSAQAAYAEWISQGASGGGFYLGHDPSRTIRVTDAFVTTSVSAAPADGLFHHYALTFDAAASQARLYVDGTLAQTLSGPLGRGATGSDTRLGSQFAGFAEFHDGDMDEVRIYQGALGAAQVAALAAPGVTRRLEFVTQPSAIAAGAVISPGVRVAVQDARGQTDVADNTTQVTLTLGANPGGATLGGTATVTVVAGVALFPSLTLTSPATGYTLVASTAGIPSPTSAPFDVTPGPASVLVFTGQPPVSVAQNTPFGVTVTARDAFGNTASGFTGTVSLSIGTNPSGGTLSGTTAVAAVAGVATFTGLTVDNFGSGYTLVASATGLTSGVSSAMAVGLSATVNQWINAAGGNWSTATNWSKGTVPTAAESVAVVLPGTYTVVLDTTFTGPFILVGGGSGTQTLSLTSRTLTVSGALSVGAGGELVTSSATLAGGGVVVNTGTMRLLNTTVTAIFSNQGTVIANATVNVNGPFTTTAASILRLQPDGTTGFSNFTSAGSFTNAGLIELTSVGSSYAATLAVSGTNTLTNAAGATITSVVGAGGGRTLNARLDNQGTVTVLQPLTISPTSAAHTNSGLMDVSGANLTISQSGTTPSFTNTGTMTVGAGRTLTVSGGALNQSAGSIGGAGTLSLTSTTANFTTNFTNATTTLTADNVTLNGPGSITNAPGQTLTLRNVTFGATATLDNQGTLVANATVNVTGPFTTTASSILRLQPDGTTGFSNFTSAGSFTNAGLIELTSVGSSYAATLAVSGTNTLTNAAGATITSVVGAGGGRTLNARLDNQGTVTVLQPLTISPTSAAHTNSGLMDVSGADLTISQSGTTPSFTNTGTMTVGAGRTLTVSGGTLNQSAGSIGGAGTLSLTSTTANFTTNFTNATTTLTADNVTLNGPGSITNAPGQTLTLRNVTFGATATLDNQGTLVANATVNVTGPFTTTASSILRLQPDGTTGFSNFTSAGSFTNAGLIELTSVGSTYGATLAVSGTNVLTNAAGATITSVVGAGGARTLNARLDNQGTVTVLQPLTISPTSAAHTNSGLIDVSGANLTISQGGTTPSFTNTGTMTIGAGRTLTVSGGTLNQSAGSIGGAGTLSLTSTTANFTTSFSTATTTLTADNATLNGPGTITNAPGQTLTLRNVTFGATATLDNQGTLVANATVNVNGPFTTTAASILRLQPDGTTGFSNFTSAGSFTNAGLIELTSVGSSYSATLAVSGTNVLTNAAGATITSVVGAGGGRTLNARLDNQGTVTVLQPLTISPVGAAHTNSGLMDVSGANLTISQSGTTPSFTNTGTMTIGAGRTLTVSGGTLNQSAGSIGGAGTLSLTSLTANFTTNFTNATTTLTADNVTLNGPGTITSAPGQTLSLRNVTFGVTTTLDNQGTVIANATVTVNGPFTTTAASILRLQPDGTTGFSNFTTAGSFTNAGLIELTSVGSSYSATLAVSGTNVLTNAAGATITSVVGAGGGRTLNARLDNQGTVTVLQPLTISPVSAAHTNSGLIDVSGANLTISQSGTTPSFTNTGTLTIGAGRTLTVSGGTLNQSAGSIGGAGTLSLTSLTANFTTNFTNATTTLTADNVTLNGPGTITSAPGQTLSLRNVTFGVTTTLDNQGTVIANATVTVNGPFTTTAASILRLQPDGTTGFSNFTTAGSFTNAGLIELTSVGSAYSATLAVSGTNVLTNAAGATITSVVGAGGGRTLNARLDNQGTVTVLQPLTISPVGAAHTNSGLIDVSGANLTISQSGTTPSFTNTGTMTVGAGRTLTVGGGVFTSTSTAVLSGPGALQLTNLTSDLQAAISVGALGVTGGAVTLAASVSTAGVALTLDGPTVNGPGIITNSAGQTLSLRNVTVAATSGLDNQGTLIANGTVAVNGPFTTTAASILRLQPDGTTGFANFTTAGSFTNAGLIELTSVGSAYSATLAVSGTNTLTNAAGATITSVVGAGGSRTLNARLDNQGTVTVLQPLTISPVGAAHTNSGLIDVSGANLTISQSGTTPSFTNTGTMTVGAGRTLTVGGGVFTSTSTAVLSGPGALQLTNLTSDLQAAISVGALGVTGGAVTLAASVSTAGVALTLDGATVNGPGTITNAAGQTLSLRNVTVAATSALDNQGTLIANGTVTVTGPFTTTAASILRLQPDGTTGFSNFTTAGSFTNAGLIELTSVGSAYSATLAVSGTNVLTNAAGATITSVVGAGGGRTLNARLDNQGTVTVLQPLTISPVSAAHTNSGLMDVSGANLTISQSGTTPSFTNTGTMTVGAGRALAVNGGAFTSTSTAVLSGSGALQLTNATSDLQAAVGLGALGVTGGAVTLAASVSTAGVALTLDGTTVNGPGTITNAAGQTLSLRNVTVAATSALDNQGTLVANGTVTVNGPFTTTAASILRLQPDGTTGFSTLSVSSLTNNGTIELTSIGSAYNALLNISGTLTNAAGGTILTVPGTGGARAINAALVNLGTITVQPGPSNAGILQVNGSLNTSGTINMQIGGTALGTGYSQITVSSTATLAGTLNVSLINAFVPGPAVPFTLLTSAPRSGTFATANMPTGAWAAPTYPGNNVLVTSP